MSVAQAAKVAGTAGAATAGFSLLGWLNDLALTLFDVSGSVIFMASLGSLLSFAYKTEGEKAISKKKLYFLIVANTALASAATAVFPEWLGWEWSSVKVEGSVALLMAATARFIIPILINLLPELVGDALRKWLKLGPRGGQAQSRLDTQEDRPKK